MPEAVPIPTWITLRQAAAITNRSKRTIQRWVADPANKIRTMIPDTSEHATYVITVDIIRVAQAKDRYRDTPTFGR